MAQKICINKRRFILEQNIIRLINIEIGKCLACPTCSIDHAFRNGDVVATRTLVLLLGTLILGYL